MLTLWFHHLDADLCCHGWLLYVGAKDLDADFMLTQHLTHWAVSRVPCSDINVKRLRYANTYCDSPKMRENMYRVSDVYWRLKLLFSKGKPQIETLIISDFCTKWSGITVITKCSYPVKLITHHYRKPQLIKMKSCGAQSGWYKNTTPVPKAQGSSWKKRQKDFKNQR